MLMKSIFERLDRELTNSIILGLVFMFVYSAFYTISNTEKIILNSVDLEKPDYNGNAFVSLSIWYVTFALFLWVVPPIIRFTGIKLAVTLGAIGYSLFLASFLPEQGWVLYLGSVCNGLGAAILWTCQGCFNILNSTPQTITRNAAIFSGFTHSSTLYGNLIVYFTFIGKETIDYDTRILVVSVLLGLSVVGVLISLTLSPPAYAAERATPIKSAAQAFRESWEVVYNKHMLLLCPMFVYCGLESSFFTGIVGAAVGFTTYADGFSSAELVPLYGFATGVGGILAQVCLVSMNPLLSAKPMMRSLVVAISVFCDYIAFLLVFLNFTNDSIFSSTDETAIINSSSWITIIIGMLLGFADGIFLPMLISMIGKIYPCGSASVVTLHTFCFSFTSAVSFFYSSYVGLHWQLLILLLESLLGVACYCYVVSDINWYK